MRSLFAFGFVSSLFLVACGGTPAGVNPELSLKSPADNSTITAPADHLVAVEFSTNYFLKPTGKCDGQDHCGTVYLLIDNTTCDQSGKPYNTQAVVSPSSVDLSLCATAAGSHKITAELHNDDGTVVESNVSHDPVTSSVTITVL
ncbi:MAG: hypothetical protein ABI321_16720 [Polyangia bacterium]